MVQEHQKTNYLGDRTRFEWHTHVCHTGFRFDCKVRGNTGWVFTAAGIWTSFPLLCKFQILSGRGTTCGGLFTSQGVTRLLVIQIDNPRIDARHRLLIIRLSAILPPPTYYPDQHYTLPTRLRSQNLYRLIIGVWCTATIPPERPQGPLRSSLSRFYIVDLAQGPMHIFTF